jgi:tRNA-splicing ligase RtcB
MVKHKMKRLADYLRVIEPEGDMNVPAFFFVNETLLELLEDKTLQQTMNMATLPGILEGSVAMPDAHMGYGFPVGGVAALDADDGVISPGGIGFDINCGVRLLRTNMQVDDVAPKIDELLNAIFDHVPCGVGRNSELTLTSDELDELLQQGPSWLVGEGYGNEDDLEHCESNGHLDDADPSKITRRAKSRGRKQVGTLGGGNHFLEIQYVDEILDTSAAATMGITHEDQVMVMIHTGSRGLGHQVCSDYLREMEDAFPEIMERLPEKDLAYAPLDSDLARDYFGAMCAAAHFAWSNRHLIGHRIRQSFGNVFGVNNLPTVYDVAHNIAKREMHDLGEGEVEAYVHRKGATRAFPPGHPEIPETYQDIGQPVLIPGSMGTCSYVLTGREGSMEKSFGSCCHGAGRVMSRTQATKDYTADGVRDELAAQDIYIKSASRKGITEEAPGAYKDVDEVIKVVADANLAQPAVKLRPLGVVKG